MKKNKTVTVKESIKKDYQLFNYLLSITEDQAVMKLQKFHLDKEAWNRLLSLYQSHYPENIKEYNYFQHLYDRYIKEFKIEKEQEENIDFYINQIEKCVNSNLPITEYCIINKIDKTELGKYAAKIRNTNLELYNQYKNLPDEITVEFKEKLLTISKMIINDDNFNLFDYYYYVNMNFDQFLYYAQSLLSEKDKINLKGKINRLRVVDSNLFFISKEKIMSAKIIISNEEITEEEKEFIIDFLIKNNMPLKIYMMAIRRHKKDGFNLKDLYYVNIKNQIEAKDGFELYDYIQTKLKELDIKERTFWDKIEKNTENTEIIKYKRYKYNLCKKDYIKQIHDFLINKDSNVSENIHFEKKLQLQAKLEKYKEYIPEDADKIEEVLDNLDYYMKLPYKNFKVALYNIIHRAVIPRKSHVVIYNLLTDKKEAISYLRKENFSKEQFDKIISDAKETFPNQPEIDNLKLIYDEYKRTYENVSKNNKNENLNPYEILIDKIYESGKTTEEYCSITGESVVKVNYVIRQIPTNEKAKIIVNRDNSNFENNIKSMVYDLLNAEDFDMTMYYDYTKLNIDDFIRIIKRIIPDEKICLKMRILILNNRRKLNQIISKEKELNNKTIISGREITKEEKEKIFNYIEEKDYPYSVYFIVTHKYLDGKLSFDKQKTYEK
jgi:hypothetical protein